MIAGPAQRVADECDLFTVAFAGGAGWGEDADLGLVAACAEVERDLRQRQWDALEVVLRYTEGTPPHARLIAPTDPTARTELAMALVTLGWGHAPPSEGATVVGTPLDIFDALSIVVRWFTADGGLDLPDDPAELDRLAAALEVTGWHEPGPGWRP